MAKVLELLNITRRFGGLNALQDVSFEVASGEILGLIGPNGAGKTTLVNVITGVHSASSGRVIFEDKEITHLSAYQTARIGLARTFQIVQPFPDLSVLDNVAAAALFSQKGLNQKEAREIARDLLQFVGLDNQVPNLARSLTLAMRKRLELAKALAMKPRLLFLDEVNAGLNTSEVERAMELIRVLAKQGITIVLIEHLMQVVVNVCSRVIVLQNGALIANGTPKEVVNKPEVIAAYLGKKYAQLNNSQAQ
jgi:branched-chain amino acid transport system ATP-binding protein